MAIPVVDDVSVDMLDFMLHCRVQFEMTLPHRVEILR